MQLEENPKASLARGQNLSPVGFHIHNKDGGSQNFLHSLFFTSLNRQQMCKSEGKWN